MPKTRSEELEEQVAYLRWQLYHKERLIKQAVEHDKYLRERDKNEMKDYKPWQLRSEVKAIVYEDEISKPLLLTRHDKSQIKTAEDSNKLKLTKACQVHIDSINRLKHEISLMTCNTKEGRELYEFKTKKLYDLEEKLCNMVDLSLQPTPKLRVTSPAHWK